MEVKKNFFIKKEIFELIKKFDTIKLSENFKSTIVNIQSFLKKEDTIHIYFSKKLSDEFIFSLLGREVKQPIKRFHRKSKNPVTVEEIHNIIDLKFFSHCDQYAIQNLKKWENFEKSINQNKFLGGKINEDSKYPKNNNIIPSYIQTNLGGNNKKMFDEEEDIKKKEID